MNLVEFVKSSRRISAPLLIINAQDAAATIASLRDVLSPKGSEKGQEAPLIRWDIINGAVGLNDVGTAAIRAILPEGVEDPAQATENLAEFLSLSTKLPARSAVFVLNLQRYLDNIAVIQAMWNLRDLFKANRRTLIGLGPDIQLPPELAQDALTFEESLPTDDELAAIIKSQYEAAKLTLPGPDLLAQAVDATRGLAPFPVEQIVAMSLRREGLDMDTLWLRKIAATEQTKGLTVYRGLETFSDIGGISQIKLFGSRLMVGPDAPTVVLFMDELEKMLGGAGTQGAGDSSGVAQDQLGVILRTTEDYSWPAILLIGPAGTTKSLYAKALARTHKRLLIQMDLGAMKGSYVGQSEAAIRAAVRTVKGVGGSRVLLIATCNKLDVLSPELRRRFKLGIWFTDLPTTEEQEAIWPIHLKKYGHPLDAPLPSHDLWTGADIRNCCEVAYRLRCSLVEAANFVVPVAKSDPKAIKALREKAHKSFLSASYPGAYNRYKGPGAPPEPDDEGSTSRDISFDAA